MTVIPAAADTVSFGTTSSPASFAVAGDVFTFTGGTVTNLLVGTTPVVLSGQSTTSSFGGFSISGGSGSCAVLCSTAVQIDVTPTNVNGTPVAAAPLVFDGSLSFTGGANGTYSLNFAAGDGGVAGTGAYVGDIVHTVGNVIYAVPDQIALGTKLARSSLQVLLARWLRSPELWQPLVWPLLSSACSFAVKQSKSANNPLKVVFQTGGASQSRTARLPFRERLHPVQAITIIPGQLNSVSLRDVAEPQPDEGSLLVKARQLGVCGTDFELINGDYGWAPQQSSHLILGHESLGEVQLAAEGSSFDKGDWVIGIVRRPDPEPCIACAVGEWDMCRNGRYTERGIKEKHGFGAERWRIEPEYAIKVEPALHDVAILVEPGSVLAKAWEHIEHIGKRAYWRPKTLLVTGAGPIGLLAALMGRQRGLAVHVLDQVTVGPKPKLVEALGAQYYTGSIQKLGFRPDVVIECSGAATLLRDGMLSLANDGIFCMVGSSAHAQDAVLNVSQLNRGMVLGNTVAFGVVNANKRHYENAAEALRRADRTWLHGLITRREPLSNWRAAFQRQPNDVKVLIDFAA